MVSSATFAPLVPVDLATADRHPERRRHPRHAMACHCWIDADQLTVLGPTQDIGVGGLFVRTAVPLDEGALVDITLRAQDEPETLTARALVARAVPVRAGYCHGLGLEFVKIHQGQRLLRALLDGLTPWAALRDLPIR